MGAMTTLDHTREYDPAALQFKPMLSPIPPLPLHQAIAQGAGAAQQSYNIARDIVMQGGEHMLAIAAYHKALIKVFEFLAAQMSLDLFKDDPIAKQVYERIIDGGYYQLSREATHVVTKDRT
jgi:hypothetical protein